MKIKEGTRAREKEGQREREMTEKGAKNGEEGRERERKRETEITGLISRSGCLAMDVDTRHLLERAATAGYQSLGSSRS